MDEQRNSQVVFLKQCHIGSGKRFQRDNPVGSTKLTVSRYCKSQIRYRRRWLASCFRKGKRLDSSNDGRIQAGITQPSQVTRCMHSIWRAIPKRVFNTSSVKCAVSPLNVHLLDRCVLILKPQTSSKSMNNSNSEVLMKIRTHIKMENPHLLARSLSDQVG
jgi:hypothetical protein